MGDCPAVTRPVTGGVVLNVIASVVLTVVRAVSVVSSS